jgi:hypothetical protein
MIPSTVLKTSAFASIVVVSGVAAFLPPDATAGAKSVGEGQTIFTQLGPHGSAVTYWTAGPEGWDVVTTIDPLGGFEAGNDHAVIRFSSRLLPGQSQTISVPAALGDQSPSLLIRRIADRLELETTATWSH